MAVQRIHAEPAYVLHRYDWSESSLILEVFTRHYGRIALVARGAKKPSSSFRPILLPLQPLHLSFGGDAEIRTLKAAQWQGGHVMPTGEGLLSGYYLNELLMRLLARDDPHPALFDAYAATVTLLAGPAMELLPVALRAFELRLLHGLGVLPALHQQTATLQSLEPQQPYMLVPEAGLREAHSHEWASLLGSEWMAIEQSFKENGDFSQTMHACWSRLPELKNQLRGMLHYHCGTSMLKTQQMMQDLQAL